MTQKTWLSHTINQDTPLYGGRTENFNIYKTSSMDEGKPANDTRLETTVHMGTHIDMPYHFYADGQTVTDFDIDFWFFNTPLFIDLQPRSFIIKEELMERLDKLPENAYDILLVRTGIGEHRGSEKFWSENYGFDPSLYEYLKKKFPSIRVLGFDSISITSWQERDLGRVAHQAFLNPKNPILILEDMNLVHLKEDVKINSIIISPLRIETSDGLPCTVFAEIYKENTSE